MRENAAILSGETLGELGFFGVIGYFIGFIVKTVVLYSVFTALSLSQNLCKWHLLTKRKAPLKKDSELVDRQSPFLNRHSPPRARILNREVHYLIYRIVIRKT